ncbi:hypothetical protein Syun_021488 [Stephania yunnanensis]|uniref:Uncharacterized protein n=1 Tax=Stephania yunnanensis TaxID=152371 RepID=A0AAP0IH60_9MAGN
MPLVSIDSDSIMHMMRALHDDYFRCATQYDIDGKDARANFLAAQRHQRSLGWVPSANRRLRPSDHSVHFLATPRFIIDDGVVELSLEECPLTPSFDEGTTTYSGDDDAHSLLERLRDFFILFL